jgi:hypothetical protein
MKFIEHFCGWPDFGCHEEVKNSVSSAIFESILRAKSEKRTFRYLSVLVI